MRLGLWILSTLALTVALTLHVAGQNYIGLHKDEIRKRAASEYKGFAFDKEVENGNRSFLKYVNVLEEQTLLFVLNDKGYCTSMSRMYNTWLLNQVKADLTKNYRHTDSLTWLEKQNDKEYEIKLKKGEWFLTVSTRPKGK